VLSEDRLRALDERYYAETTMYQTEQWNEQGLFAWEREAVNDHFSREGRLAVVACGGGREVLALRGDGYDAVGYESHPDLAAYGRELLTSKGHPSTVEWVERDTFPGTAGACAGVIVGWGAYSLIGTRDQRIALLRAARDHVPAGAPLLLSFLQRSGNNRAARWTALIANAVRRARGAPPTELGDTLSPNRVHLFTTADIADEAAAGGFDLAEHRVTSEIEPGLVYASAVLRSRT
jgi:hypothetical protein